MQRDFINSGKSHCLFLLYYPSALNSSCVEKMCSNIKYVETKKSSIKFFKQIFVYPILSTCVIASTNQKYGIALLFTSCIARPRTGFDGPVIRLPSRPFVQRTGKVLPSHNLNVQVKFHFIQFIICAYFLYSV